jgi:VanZ family protein
MDDARDVGSSAVPIAGNNHAPSVPVRAVCLVCAAILVSQLFYQGASPEAAGLIPSPWDKLAHFMVYSAITALIWVGTAGRIPLAAFALVAAIGALDEPHQAFLPGRFADAWDFATNVGAAAIISFAPLLLFRGPAR